MIMAGFGFRLVLMLMLVLVFVARTATCSNEGKKERKKERKDVSKKDGRQKSDQHTIMASFFRHVRHLDHSVHFFYNDIQ